MIPLSDDNRQRRTFPWINNALIIFTIVVFLHEQQLASQPGDALSLFESSCALTPAALLGGHAVAAPCAAWITPLTSIFIHAGWLHISGNMLFLWIFGDNVEDAMGHGRYLLFYLMCGLAAGFTQVVFNWRSPVPELGASGAIAGVLGAYLVLFPRARVNTLLILGIFITATRLSALTVISLWFIVQFAEALGQIGQQASGGVALWAHVGGFFAGVLLVQAFRRRVRSTIDNRWRPSSHTR